MTTCNCCGGNGRQDLFTVNGFTLGRCTACNLHYVDPMPDGDSRLADVHAGRYGDQQVLDAEKQLAAERAQSRTFREYLDLIKTWGGGDGRFLDIGCGAGYLMTLAREAGYQPEGIELTADRLVAARATGATVHDRPIEEIGYPDDTFAAETLINVFSHLADPMATLREAARTLRPGGVLIVATGEIAGEVKRGHLPEWTLGDEMFYLGAGTIDRYAEAAGMEVVETRRTWLVDAIYTRERFKVRGRSRIRNGIKSVMLLPGALAAARWVIKRRQADNPIHSAIYVLRKPSR